MSSPLNQANLKERAAEEAPAEDVGRGATGRLLLLHLRLPGAGDDEDLCQGEVRPPGASQALVLVIKYQYQYRILK